jgi:hypothetical protein
MAHFYVSCQGSRGSVHRLGGKNAGVRATLAGWQGSIQVRLYERDGVDYVVVTRGHWNGTGDDGTIYDGPVNRAMVKPRRKAKR